MNLNQTPLERLLVRAIVVLSGFLLFVPLFIFSQSYFPFIVVKAALMRVVIELIVFLYVVLWLNDKKKWQPRFSWVGAILLFYIVIMTLSAIFGASPTRSFWSNWERMSGVFTFWHYGLWFMILTTVIKDTKYWKVLAWSTLTACFLMSVYAWLQYANVHWSFVYMASSDRLSGTLGNPAYFGSYMTMHAFIAALMIFSVKGWQRWLLSVYSVYLIFMVLLSGTRGAFLGLVAAGAVLMILILSLKLWRNKIYRWLGVVGLVLIVIGGLLVAFKNTTALKNSYIIERFGSVSVSDNTAQTRLHSWSYGLKGFSEKWLLGYGPENFHVPFNKFFTADFYDYTGNEIWFDYAHSMLVETAATMGIGGFLGYIGLYLAVVFVAIKYRSSATDKNRLHQSIIMVMAMVAILVQNSFVFDSFNTYIILFFILAWATSWQIEASEIKKYCAKFVPVTLSFVLIIFVFYGLVVNVQAMAASSLVFQSYEAQSNGDNDKALELLNETMSLTNNLADPMIMYSQVLAQIIPTIKTQSDAQKLNERFVQAEPLMLKAMEGDSQSESLRLTLSRFYMTWGQFTRNPEYLKKAEAEAQKAVDFSPQRLHAIWMLAQAQLMQAKYDEADVNLAKAIELNPKQGQSYWLRFFVASAKNDKDKAAEYSWLAHSNGFEIQSLPIVEDAIIYALKNKITIASPELQTAVKEAINLGTSKQFILDLAKELPGR